MPRKANGRADKHRDDEHRMPGEAGATNGKPPANGMPGETGRMPMTGMAGAPGSGGAGNMPGGMGGGGQAGGAGMSGPGSNGGRTDQPTRRQCGVMDVHRRLLSSSPEYAAARS